MKYLWLIIFLIGCTAVGEQWILKDGDTKLTLVERLKIKGVGARTYKPGGEISKEEPIKTPDVFVK